MINKRLDIHSESIGNHCVLKGNIALIDYGSTPLALPIFAPRALGIKSNFGNNTTNKYGDIPTDNDNINIRKDDIHPHTEIDFTITTPRKK